MDDKLIGQNPRDQLVLKALSLIEEQKTLEEAEWTEHWKDRNEEEKLRTQRVCKQVYLSAFCALAYEHLKLNKKLITKLSDEEFRELASLIYEKAKNRLWLKKFCRIILGLSIPIFGWMALFIMFYKQTNAFPCYKLVVYHLWYEENFGTISQDAFK